MYAYLLKAEHEVKLADIAKISVQCLHQAVNELQNGQLVLQVRTITLDHLLRDCMCSGQLVPASLCK